MKLRMNSIDVLVAHHNLGHMYSQMGTIDLPKLNRLPCTSVDSLPLGKPSTTVLLVVRCILRIHNLHMPIQIMQQGLNIYIHRMG
jgi:hypothetical protein